eukprot:g13505.t1
MTTTTTYPLSSFCGPWNPVGGFAEISWNGGDFPALAFDGNGWEWRVFLKSTVEGAEESEPEDRSDGGRRLSTDVNCQAQAYVLQLVWLPGQQEDSQFLVWHVELYKLTIVAGQIDRSQDVQIPDVCKGLLDRANTRCFVPDLAFGLYSFAVQEISMVPATSSPLSATSLPVWVPRRRAAAPVAVQLSEATVSGARIAWSNAALEDSSVLGDSWVTDSRCCRGERKAFSPSAEALKQQLVTSLGEVELVPAGFPGGTAQRILNLCSLCRIRDIANLSMSCYSIKGDIAAQCDSAKRQWRAGEFLVDTRHLPSPSITSAAAARDPNLHRVVGGVLFRWVRDLRGRREGTGYYFRARELCSNGAPLASGWGNTEEALRTTSVPVVQQPSFIDPQGFLVGQYAPQRLMLFFDTDLALGDSSVALSICPSLPGTVADPGACNCVSVADCASKCVTRDVVQVLLQSSRVALVDFAEALPRPLTSCPYDVIVEEGLLKTQLTPAKLSPRITWSFTYSPPPPIGMVTLHSSTTTSMTVDRWGEDFERPFMCPCPCPPYFWHPFCFFAENTELGMGDEIGRRHQVRVTWDRPMTVRCGVASEAAPGGIAQLSEPEDFTGARDFVEVPITGLLPFTQYSVVCTGKDGTDVRMRYDAADSLFQTEHALELSVCNDESETEVFTALYPPFDPTSRNYQVTLNAEAWLRDTKLLSVWSLLAQKGCSAGCV